MRKAVRTASSRLTAAQLQTLRVPFVQRATLAHGSGAEELFLIDAFLLQEEPEGSWVWGQVVVFAMIALVVAYLGQRLRAASAEHSELETELRRLGAGATAGRDSLEIRPARLLGAEITTYEDHRMAMAFALAGLRVPGVVIRDPGCVSKTWPEYFSMLEHL